MKQNTEYYSKIVVIWFWLYVLKIKNIHHVIFKRLAPRNYKLIFEKTTDNVFFVLSDLGMFFFFNFVRKLKLEWSRRVIKI